MKHAAMSEEEAELWDKYDQHIKAEEQAEHWSLWWNERNRQRLELRAFIARQEPVEGQLEGDAP